VAGVLPLPGGPQQICHVNARRRGYIHSQRTVIGTPPNQSEHGQAGGLREIFMTTRNGASASRAIGGVARSRASHPPMESAVDGTGDWLEQAVKTRELALRRAGLSSGNGGEASAASLARDALNSAYLVECERLFELTRTMLNADRERHR